MWSAAALLFLAGSCSQHRSGSPSWGVGQWVRYEVTSRGSSWQLEYAVVGREGNGQSQLFWLEARRFSERDSLFVKWLVPPGLSGRTERVLVGRNRASASLQVEGSYLPDQVGSDCARDERGQPAEVERVETPAGKFVSEKFIRPSGPVWLSRDVPIFGVVRSRNEEVEMVLVAYGKKGATSELTDVPGTVIVP